jgi:hypothetical protein
MGFFDSIFGHVADAGDWLLHHANDVVTVGTAILNAAGKSAADTTLDNTNNLLPTIFSGLNGAATALANQMDKVLPIPNLSEDPNVTYADLTGVWKDPTLAPLGAPRQQFYSDITNFMALHNLPTTVGDSSTEGVLDFQDIAKAVAAAVFSMAPQSQATIDPSTGIITLPFDVNASGQGIDIHGVHVFYKIPLGQHEGWQSHIRLKVVQSNAAKAADANKKKMMALPKATPPPPPYNCTTILVIFQSASGTDTIMSQVQADILSKNQDWVINATTSTPLQYTYNIFTPSTIFSGAVADAFNESIASHIPPPSPPSGPSCYPSVTITYSESQLD